MHSNRMGSLRQSAQGDTVSCKSASSNIVPRLHLELLESMESPRVPQPHPTSTSYEIVEPVKNRQPMFPPIPQPRTANDCEIFTATLKQDESHGAVSMARAASSSGTGSSEPTPRSGPGRATPPGSRGSSTGRPTSSSGRPGSASGRVIVCEYGEGRSNPRPIITEETDNLLEEYLSPRKLRALTGTEDLDEVTILEMKVDSREMSLGNFGMYLPNLEQLKLSNSIINTVRDLGSQLTAVRVLWMAQCGLKELDGLGSMMSLQELYLAYNEVSDLSPCTMLEKLEVLDVEGNHVSEVSQLQFLALCPCLKCLTLENNPVCLTPHPDEADPTYNYRAQVLALLPDLQLLDDQPLTDKIQGPEHVNDLFQDDWKLLEELEQEGMTPGAEETVQLEFSVRPGTGIPPITSYRPGSALRPYTAGIKPTSGGSPIQRPPTGQPSTSNSTQNDDDEKEEKEEDAVPVEEASELTRGFLLSGNLARALKLKRKQGLPKSLRDCPKLAKQLEQLRSEGKLNEIIQINDLTAQGDDGMKELMSEIETFRMDHSKVLQSIAASKAPQILKIENDESLSLGDSDTTDEEVEIEDTDSVPYMPFQLNPVTSPIHSRIPLLPQFNKSGSPVSPTHVDRNSLSPVIRSPSSPPSTGTIRKGKLANVPLLPTKHSQVTPR